MDAIVFVALVAGVAIVGLALGLALAPRLTRWDEGRNGPVDEVPDEHGGGEDDRD